MSQANVQTKTFIEYLEYDMYEQYTTSREVTTRDPVALAVSKQINDWPNNLPFEFHFYDADVAADGSLSNKRNVSPEYRQADKVMSLDDYKKQVLPRIAEYKKEKQGRFSAFTTEFLDGGFSLKRAFKAALGPRKPVMDWYIQGTERMIAECEKAGIKTVALRSDHELTSAEPVAAGFIVVDSKGQQLYPAAAQPAPKAAPQP